MARKRLYHTPEQKREANRLKSVRYRSNHRESINAKRRRGAPKSCEDIESTTIGVNKESKDALGGSSNATVEDIRAVNTTVNYTDSPKKRSKGKEKRRKARDHSTEGVARAKIPPNVNKEHLQKLFDSDDEAWDESWQEHAARTAQLQYNTAVQMGQSVSLAYFQAKKFVRTEASNGTPPTIEPAAPDDDRPLWVREVMARRTELRQIYESVGASERKDFLPELYKAHVQKFISQGSSDLLRDYQHEIGGVESRLQEQLDKVWYRYRGGGEPTCYVQRLLDRVERMRVELDEMVIIDMTGTEELIHDYEQGVLPFQNLNSCESSPPTLTTAIVKMSSIAPRNIHPRAERPLKATEKKMIKAMTSLTPTQKRWLSQFVELHVQYRDSRVDRTHVRFWAYMRSIVNMFLRRWCPGMWTVWRRNLKQHWRRCIQENIIRYYDWKTGYTRGLRKLQRNWFPVTPPPSPAGPQPQVALSIPMFSVDSPTRPSIGRGGKRFEALFSD